jgi:hypothetical protein
MPTINLDDVEDFETDFDFGFTTASESDFKARETVVAQQVEQQVSSEANTKVLKMYKMVLPLLNNLMKDADTKEYIYWPSRKTKIQEFMTKLQDVVNS